MPNIITPADAREHLRLDTDYDAWLDLAIPTVESAIVHWCGAESRLYDSEGALHPSVRMAALVELAYQYRFREGAENLKMIDWYRTGYTLSTGATALLQPHRCPRIS